MEEFGIVYPAGVNAALLTARCLESEQGEADQFFTALSSLNFSASEQKDGYSFSITDVDTDIPMPPFWEVPPRITRLLLNHTDTFEKDLNKFSDTDRQRITERIDRYCQMLFTDEAEFYRQTYQPYHIELHGGLETSLYTLRLGEGIRVILTVDDDPLFDQIIVTLIKVVNRSELPRAFISAAKSLYQSLLFELHEAGEEDYDPIPDSY
ncbi:MAG: hypothetical protein KKA73_26365 [Chloroflexi bacterium]|nr:hypothetical protein [Chloroflexota bacterium]